MNYQERLREISQFLLPYQRIWQNEIMLMYPNPLSDYPMDWINELAGFRAKDEVISLEKKEVFDYIKIQSLRDFYQKLEELCQLPHAPELAPMPSDKFTFLFMIPKKQYEIKKLAPLINHFYHQYKMEKIIDIGGGIGLLAQSVCNQYNLPVVSVDMDPALQKTGIKRHEKNAKNQNNKVQYVNLKVDAKDFEFKKLLNQNSMTIGLHTCGSLANSQIITSSESQIKGIINFGCCYLKLEGDDEGQNISSFAKSLNQSIFMNPFALTLASRAHRKMSEEDYELKQKVKAYRYTLHILLHDEYNQRDLISVGNSSPKLYNESFGTYALEQLSRISITPKHTKEELDQYFENPERRDLVWKMVCAGLIRNAFGRVLEMYILIDRACYLEEAGYKVEVLEMFDEELSPRNIGIFAHLPTK